ncbi:unnamed protein product [Symbiodinium sp. CCMP2592]|nr:unnamed protein product [Symbiodinium sp. CCMP2592]
MPGPNPVFHEMLLPTQLARSTGVPGQPFDEDADLSDATTLKLGDHLVSKSESDCEFCDVMPANAGCCVGCGCSLVEAPKMVESDESQEEIPAFLADAANAMVDSQENGSLCEALQQLAIDERVPAPYNPGRGSAPTLPVPPEMASVTELLHGNGFSDYQAKKKREQRDGDPKKGSKKLKSASKEGGKASFKRPKKSNGARLSEASTAAPSSVAVSEPAPEGRAMVPVPEPNPEANPGHHMWMEYDLEKIGIPAEARPTENGRGKHSYTIRMGGATFDILMKKRGYYVKKPVGEGKKGTVSWGNNGGPALAWEKVKKHAGLN